MRLKKPGKTTSAVEVTNISAHGFWIWVRGKEYFVPYADYPWFTRARVSEILNVKLYHASHLHWPDLDVDLCLESLENPDAFPLVYT
jgi:hypothetical protein